MAKNKIDLGYSYDEPEVAKDSSSDKKVHYPSITISGGEDVPAEGKAVVTFEKVAYRKEGYRDGKPECEISVKSIEFEESKSKDEDGYDELAGDF